jgi:hypothetical protein
LIEKLNMTNIWKWMEYHVTCCSSSPLKWRTTKRRDAKGHPSRWLRLSSNTLRSQVRSPHRMNFKKIFSLCLVRSQVLSHARHFSVWTVVEWTVVTGPLVMEWQDSRVFSIGTCWFRDLLVISKLYVPWVSTPDDIGEDDFPLPGWICFTKRRDGDR